MLNKLKSIGATGLSFAFGISVILLGLFLLRGGVTFTTDHQELLGTINAIIIGLIILLFLLAIVPKLRMVAGVGIVYASSIWIFLYWLNCLAITYALWGFVGSFIGIILFGFGVFITAILAVLFTGQWGGALSIVITLLVMFVARFLGALIATKRQERLEKEGFVLGSSEADSVG